MGFACCYWKVINFGVVTACIILVKKPTEPLSGSVQLSQDTCCMKIKTAVVWYSAHLHTAALCIIKINEVMIYTMICCGALSLSTRVQYERGEKSHLGGFVEETRSTATVQEVVVFLYVTVRESLG